ncbi:hypothetical protein B1813_13620 [Saccharomonospora piscinae]|uniref:DUF4097 domain-containing protein n=1 Tax=Saccharomonospora piscinae TaxID=687388 RepID=A0A1V9A0Q6_SACPI|nr:DUF4097 family beta strand repeat-containing protein [Saccharomonospora piscinae]OQO90593.1 hypothetical protein B1813_13620 [Saccharomonospora piscinae]
MSRVGLGVTGAALVVVGLWVAFDWELPWAGTTVERTNTVERAVERVDLDNGSGDVVVRAVAGTEGAVVEQRLNYHGDEPGAAYTLSGTTLELHGCGADCAVEYQVTVPLGTRVEGEVSSGDVVVENAGDVSVRASSGDVRVLTTAEDGASVVSAEASSGDLSLDVDGVETVNASVKSGDIGLDLGRVGSVHAQTSSGDIEAAVPPGTYRVGGTTSSGDREIHEQARGADRVLDLTTSSGDVLVQRG